MDFGFEVFTIFFWCGYRFGVYVIRIVVLVWYFWQNIHMQRLCDADKILNGLYARTINNIIFISNCVRSI